MCVCPCVGVCVCVCACTYVCMGEHFKVPRFGILVDVTEYPEEMEGNGCTNCDPDLDGDTVEEGEERYLTYICCHRLLLSYTLTA